MRYERVEEHRENLPHDRLRSLKQDAEIVSRSGEHGIDRVTLGSAKTVLVHPVVVFDVTYNGLDGGEVAHLANDGGRHAALFCPEAKTLTQ